MTSIPLEDLFLIVYVLVDDWYQSKGKHYLPTGAELALVGREVAPVVDPD
jgi:hypothetical protein